MPKGLVAAFAVACLVPAGARAGEVQYGGGAIVGAPLGELADNVEVLGGIGGHTVFAVRPGEALGLRLDGSIQLYGSRTLHVPVGPPGGRQTDDVETDNWVANVAVGPQFVVPSGPVRPYLHPFVGISYFSTTTDVTPPRGGPFSFTRTSTNFDDTVFSYGAGAGLLVGFGDGHVALDLGARYVRNGRVSYLTADDLKDDGSGGVVLLPRRTRGDLVEVRLGIAIVSRAKRPR